MVVEDLEQLTQKIRGAHTKSDSTINDVLQPDAVANAITGTRTTS